MFENSQFLFDKSHQQALERLKIKKILFQKAKESYSDDRELRLVYYKCVNSVLNNPSYENSEADKEILRCKMKLDSIFHHIEDTNKHARIKVDRCITSKKSWTRRLKMSLTYEVDHIWECYNRYHRRYLYYYPGILKEKFNL
jgi:hypothetical protein